MPVTDDQNAGAGGVASGPGANAAGGGGANAGGAGPSGGDGGEPAGDAAASSTPAFEFVNDDQSENFDLRPRADLKAPVPPAQRKVSHEVYEARNVLKLLKEDKAIRQATYEEFIRRVVQAGYVGCVAKYADPSLALDALTQIRADIVRRVGTPLAYRYLLVLAGWALAGGVVGVVLVLVQHYALPQLSGAGWILIGAMAGAWFSVAAARWQIAFDTIPTYLDFCYEPLVRMLFAALVAAAFALFLHLSILSVKIGAADLGSIGKSVSLGILVGFIAGIAQRALSVQLLERAEKVLNPGAG